MTKEVMTNCGLSCEIDFADLEDRKLNDVIEGKSSIYDVI